MRIGNDELNRMDAMMNRMCDALVSIDRKVNTIIERLDKTEEKLKEKNVMSTGERIRKRRKELGISGSQLAKRARISYMCVMNVERGVNEPRQLTLDAICKVLEMPLTLDNVKHAYRTNRKK